MELNFVDKPPSFLSKIFSTPIVPVPVSESLGPRQSANSMWQSPSFEKWLKIEKKPRAARPEATKENFYPMIKANDFHFTTLLSCPLYLLGLI